MGIKKLGRKARVTDSRTLGISKYLTSSLPAAPAYRDWLNNVSKWGMMLNDTLGDCTCAAVGHAVQVWTLNAANEVTVPDSEILAIYERWCGYNPNNPSTDQGGIPLNVLNDWKSQGFFGYNISAFVSVPFSNLAQVKQAIDLFGGVYIGLELPITAQDQQACWSVVNDGGSGDSQPGSWGGHCVFVAGYSPNTLKCITWGQDMYMTYNFWNTYVDECYAILSPEWISSNGDAMNGFDMQALQADIALL